MAVAADKTSAVESGKSTKLKPLRLSKALKIYAEFPRKGLVENALKIFSRADSDNDELATLHELRSAMRKLQVRHVSLSRWKRVT